MEHLQNAMKEGEFARFVNDAIANINYKSETELLIKNYQNEYNRKNRINGI